MIEIIERGNIKDPAVMRQFEYMAARLRGLLSQTFDQDGNLVVANPNLATVPVGGLVPFTGATAPTGYLLCDGSQVSRVKYADLFRVVGTTYGVGNGTTTFTLPDMTSRFPRGKRASGAASNLGDTGGQFDHVHSVGSHTHSFSATSGAAGAHGHTLSIDSAGDHSHTFTTGEPDGVTGITSGVLEAASNVHTHDGTTSSNGGHSHTGSTDSQSNHTHSVSGTTGSSAGADSGAANPPYMAVNYLIYTGVSA